MKTLGLLLFALILGYAYVMFAFQQVRVEADIVVGEAFPEVVVTSQDIRFGNNLKLNIQNPTGQDIIFQLTSGRGYKIPAHSSKNVYLDITPLHNRVLPYRILHPSNGHFEEGLIVNNGSLEEAIASL